MLHIQSEYIFQENIAEDDEVTVVKIIISIMPYPVS